MDTKLSGDWSLPKAFFFPVRVGIQGFMGYSADFLTNKKPDIVVVTPLAIFDAKLTQRYLLFST